LAGPGLAGGATVFQGHSPWEVKGSDFVRVLELILRTRETPGQRTQTPCPLGMHRCPWRGAQDPSIGAEG
jgi:hypothetical protein